VASVQCRFLFNSCSPTPDLGPCSLATGATTTLARAANAAQVDGETRLSSLVWSEYRAAMTVPRRAERVSVDAFVKVTGDGHELVFRTRDVSEHGVFLYTKVTRAYPFRVGSTLELELFGYDEVVRCKAVVVRVVDPGSVEADTFPTGFGVRILEAAPEARAALSALIERIKLDGGAY
jgi:hypothetical protein